MNVEEETTSANFSKYNSNLLSNRPIMSSKMQNKYLAKIDETDGKSLMSYSTV